MFAYLKQSTASQTRTIGPFYDDTDYKTLETGLTIANTDVKLIKNGAVAVDKNSGGGTHRANGCYAFTFDATDTNTVGELHVSILVSGALLSLAKYWVLEESAYDALFGASATGFDATGGVTLKSGTHTGAVIPTVSTLTGHTAQTGDNYARLGAPAGASLAADVAANQVDLNTIIADTNEVQTDWANGGRLDLLLDAIKAVTDLLPNAGALSDVAAILALLDDPRTEPGQANPPVNPDLATKIDYLYKAWRNKKTGDGSTTKLYADDGTTVDQKQATSEAGGTLTKGEWVTGP